MFFFFLDRYMICGTARKGLTCEEAQLQIQLNIFPAGAPVLNLFFSPRTHPIARKIQAGCDYGSATTPQFGISPS